MEYTMRAGVLYLGERAVARIKSALSSPRREVCSADGSLLLRAEVRVQPSRERTAGDVRLRRYVLTDGAGEELAVARPDYARGEAPEVAGWPLCRVPRVDRARVQIGAREYQLYMESGQSYVLRDGAGRDAVQVLHQGLIGGWSVRAEEKLSPGLICGVFIFCRYIEQENEFLIV